jgi:hypothetical protein
MHTDQFHSRVRAAVFGIIGVSLVACSNSGDSTGPTTAPDALQLTASQVTALDSSGLAIEAANPGRGDLKSLVDSTLLVLTAGVQAKRLDVVTDLTTKPLYFIGVHRAVTSALGSFSTWTLIGMDDPAHLANIIEVSGFAQSAAATAPTSVNGTIGGGGFVNAMLLQVGTAGAVAEWSANTGTVSFSSDAPGAACPGFTSTATVACAIETMHVHFTAAASTGIGGTGSRQATLATDVDVPAMRLTYAR